MDIKLDKITLHNFAGIASFEMTLNGADAHILGGNATGKTTIVNALIWLLTGKNAADACMNPLPKGCAPETASSVEGAFMIGDEIVTLRREYAEVIAKRRTQTTERKFATRCFYDGAPVTLTDYEERLKAITPLEMLPLLMLPGALARMDWAERRRLLVSLYGEADKSEILRTMELDALAAEKGRLSWSDLRTKLTAARKKAITAQKEIPGRLDEAERQLSQVSGARTVQEIAELIHTAEERRRAMSASWYSSEADRELSQLRGLAAQLSADRAAEAAREEARQALQAQGEQMRRELSRLDTDLEAARDEFRKARGISVQGNTCPYCGQELPADKAKALTAEYTRNRDELLNAAREKGHTLKKRREELAAELAGIDERAGNLPASSERDWAGEAAALKQQILQTEENARQGAGRPVREALTDIEREIAELYAEKGRAESAAYAAQRRRALEDDLRAANAELDRVDRLLYQYDEFMKAFAEESSRRINQHFRRIRFNMTEMQNNGIPREACAILVNGVEYRAAARNELNTEACINAGLEMLDELGNRLGMRWPVLIDNAESVEAHRLLSVQAQMLRFSVSEYQTELTVKIITQEDKKTC